MEDIGRVQCSEQQTSFKSEQGNNKIKEGMKNNMHGQSLVLVNGGAKQRMIEFMGGRPKQRIVKYRLCWRYDWTQKPGYSVTERFHAWGA